MEATTGLVWLAIEDELQVALDDERHILEAAVHRDFRHGPAAWTPGAPSAAAASRRRGVAASAACETAA